VGQTSGRPRRWVSRRVAMVGVAAVAAVALAGPSAGEVEQSPVTLFARQTTIRWAQPVELFGAARGARPGELVRIEQKECGVPSYQTLVETHASEGGGWSISTGLLVTTTFRAVFRDQRSNAVTVRQSPNVVLERERAGKRFVVTVTARKSFWRKHVLIQRRAGRSWQMLRRVALTDSLALSGTLSGSQATCALDVPKRALLRAVVPRDQARPCYVTGASRVIRT
jgi:hypothetical protein